MTNGALFRSWRWRIQIRPGLHDLIMAAAAVVVKGLLICHDRRLGAAFKLHLRYFRQELWFCVSASMTIATDGSNSVRIFLRQFHCQGRGSICRPNGLMRRVFECLGYGLRRVMAVNAGKLFRTVWTAV